jgi:hypothetical protein
LGSSQKLAYYLVEGIHFYDIAHGVKPVFFWIRLIDLVFSLCILYWLMTKDARR